MNDLVKWFQDHKPSAHTVTAIWVMLDTLWYTNTEFHTYITDGFNASPKWLHALVAGVVIPIFVYWRTARTAKVTATIEPGSTGAATVKAVATPAPDSSNASK